MGGKGGEGDTVEHNNATAKDPEDLDEAAGATVVGTKRRRPRTPAMLKQNQEAQRRYRMRIKLKAAAKDAEIINMRARLGCAEKLVEEINHLKVELEHRELQMRRMQQEMLLAQTTGRTPSSTLTLAEICNMNSEVNEFIDRLQTLLHSKGALATPPVLAVVNDFRTMFDRLVGLVSNPGTTLFTTLESRKAFDHPREQSSWFTATAEAFLSQEQVNQIHTMYKQMSVNFEPILMARRSLAETLLGLHSGWENALDHLLQLGGAQITAMNNEIEGMPAQLNAVNTADISMLLAIAQSTQQKFAEMVNNIMQDSRLEANMDATLLSKVLNESQIAKIIMLTQNNMPSVWKLGLSLEKMGAFDVLGSFS